MGAYLVVVVALLAAMAATGARGQCLTPNDTPPDTPPPLDLTAATNFTLALFRHLYQPGAAGSLVASPFSVWVTLVVAALGAGGATLEQLREGLRLPHHQGNGKEDLLNLHRSLAHRYGSPQGRYELDMATRVYVDRRAGVRECLGEALHPHLHHIDSMQAKEAAATINHFVNKTTKGHIPSIVNAEGVKGAAMVLVNAVYFRGLWNKPFQPDLQPHPFQVGPGQVKEVEMMVQTAQFRIGRSKELGARVLELPYEGKDASMFILLPSSQSEPQAAAATSPLDSLVAKLNYRSLEEALKGVWGQSVAVKMPKFSLQHTVPSSALTKALGALGIRDLFTPRANLSAFSPGGGLMVTEAVHKATIDVDQEGTTASAATAITVALTSLPPEPVPFTCDRPFLFLIRDNSQGNILFLGAFTGPEHPGPPVARLHHRGPRAPQ